MRLFISTFVFLMAAQAWAAPGNYFDYRHGRRYYCTINNPSCTPGGLECPSGHHCDSATRSCEIDEGNAVECEKVARDGNGRARFNRNDSERLCNGALNNSPALCGIKMLKSFPHEREEAISMCQGSFNFHGVFAPNSKHRTLVTTARRGKSLQEENKTPEEKRKAMTWAHQK